MAHTDGRRSPFDRQPDYHSPQSQEFPERTSNSSPPKQNPSRPPAQQANNSQPRSRASSARSDASSQQNQTLPQPQPINDAVSYAFDTSDAAHKVDPGLVAQITEQVINSLKASGFNGTPYSQSKPAQQAPPPPPLSQSQPQHATRPTRRYSYTPRSPSSTEAAMPSRYSPPSPHKPDHYSSFGSDSADSPVEDSQRRENLKSRKPQEKMPSPPPSVDGPSDRRSSHNSHRPSISQEETTLEKIWQPLFDEEGRPTERLSCFLRGLAIHIIEDFEPKHSIVIGPAKMLKFYELSRVSEERYLYSTIFNKIPNSSISRIYRELRCQHHLVQHAHHEVPTIPGLTARGFETWLTTMIRAHPDTEFERLAKCVLEMPISNADHRPERFPKELSRRLFPKKEDVVYQQRLATAMATDNSIPPSQYRGAPPSFPPPPSVASNTTASSFTERERTPYAGTSKAASVASADSSFEEDSRSTASFHSTSSVPIERERKPYTAQVGGGKVYNEDIIASFHQNGPPRHNSTGPLPPPGSYNTNNEQSSSHPNGNFSSHTPTPTQKAPNPVAQGIPNRSQSVRADATMRPIYREPTQAAGQPTQAGYPGQSAGIDIPPPPPGTGRHYRTNSQVGGRRPRSPSFTAGTAQPPFGTSAPGGPARASTFARSEGNMSEIPQSWYASNLHGDNVIDDDDARGPPPGMNAPGFGSGPGGMGRKAGVRTHAQSVATDGMGPYGASPGAAPPTMMTGSVPPMHMARDRSATAGGTGTPMGAPGMMGMDGRAGANGYEGRGSAYDDDHPRRPNSNYYPPPPPPTTRY
ncbi:MAG: hypothetical protein M1822_008512 [Bathelium mastoideum]|nr:MAG: hypothetical protein M1822_008512 [Bathelium mastoideum]